MLLREKGRGSPEAFLLAWVAWEGLKIRLLVVGLAMQGWRVQDIYEVLSEQRVHDHRHIRNVFKGISGSFPENTSGMSQAWQQIEAFRDVRNRYVHGTRGADPARLEAGTHLITEHVLDTGWLEEIQVRGDSQNTRLGDPYRRLPSRRSGQLSKSSLTDAILQARPKR